MVEGTIRPRRVAIGFPDLKSAQGCYRSPEYQTAKALRDGVSLVDLCIVDGWT